jgi:DNA ligase-1
MAHKRKVGFQLASVWSPTLKRDLSGWLWSEKLDGVRAMWDGKRDLVSRNGIVFKSPGDFTATLPKGIMLDGELWIDRGMFHDTVSLIRTHPVWSPMIKFMIFDIWSPQVKNMNFRDRLSWLRESKEFEQLDDHVRLVDTHSLESCTQEEIYSNMEHILSQGGEGLILRDPQGLYTPGRQSPLRSPILKVKPFLDDEGEVLDVSLLTGRRGSVTVRDTCGRVFKIGSGFRDISSEPPPTVGSVITFGFTSRHENTGIPRFPRYIRSRSDFGL